MYVFIVLILIGSVVCNEKDLRRIDEIYSEELCNSSGGTCVIATDCRVGYRTDQSGLCPKQEAEGVECCHDVSVKETRCQKRGGECMSNCNPRLIAHLAKDCPVDKYCCILVQ